MQLAMPSNQYAVEVFNDQAPTRDNPWIRLGVFNGLDQAIAACKKVIDDYLSRHGDLMLSADELATNYLMYGPVPCINGEENLKLFDLYEYLGQQCIKSANTECLDCLDQV